MKVITAGHKYELANFENPEGSAPQVLQFIEKVPDPVAGGCALVTVNNGTTNEEVLAMLIDRMNSLQSKFPCRENAIAITKMQEALLWLNHRTEQRKLRGVEGKQLQ